MTVDSDIMKAIRMLYALFSLRKWKIESYTIGTREQIILYIKPELLEREHYNLPRKYNGYLVLYQAMIYEERMYDL